MSGEWPPPASPPELPDPVDLVDLVNCADEPIRVPHAIQPHGVLLALHPGDLTVAFASDNYHGLFGASGDVAVGTSILDGAAGRIDVQGGLAAFLGSVGADESARSLPLLVHGEPVDLVAHLCNGLLITEWEPLAGGRQAGAVWHHQLPRVLQRLTSAGTLAELGELLATAVRELTGFDRVMVYRFDADWTGEVVAEDRRPDLDPLLGLRFPASDIPAQARALYETNWLRLIPDTAYQAVPLSPTARQPVDLSGSVLRSVSPVHLEYLANMGVKASMSISLIDSGKLWGLIACHHYAGPHRPSYDDRIVAEFLGRTASALLHTKALDDVASGVLQVSLRHTQLLEAISRTPRRPLSALSAADSGILDLFPATGAAIFLDGRLTLLGRTPPADRVIPLVAELLARDPTASGAVGSRRLSVDLPGAADLSAVASGVLAVPVGRSEEGFLAWFRVEELETISWAGNPHEAKVVATDIARLRPRHSFAEWSETVRGSAPAWLEHEHAAAVRLGAHLTDIEQRRLDEDSRTARSLHRILLVEQLPDIPGLVMAARYLPAAHDLVGGDWYDLVLLPSGKVSLVLGDVAGHGVSAAATTAQLRHGLRAYLLRDDGPGPALTALNALIVSLLPDDIATVAILEINVRTGEVAIASAGHLPPLLQDASGGRLLDRTQGPPLGVRRTASAYPETRLTLSGDDRLLLFSDGLVERRGHDLDADLQRLGTAADGSAREPNEWLDRILSALDPPDTDDVTILAVGLDQTS